MLSPFLHYSERIEKSNSRPGHWHSSGPSLAHTTMVALTHLLIALPFILPRRKDTLYLASKPEEPHPLHKTLTLLGCYLSGDSLLVKAFQRQLPASSSKGGERALRNSMRRTSSDGNCTVVNGNIDPLSASVIQGVNFLSELYQKHQLSYSALNTARSALSPIIFPSGGGTFGSHPLVTRFLRGVFNTRLSLPRYQEIWDISIGFTYLKSLHPPEKLTLKDLTMKTTMLVALLSGQRCQTIHALDVYNIVLTKDRCTFYIHELLKTSRPGKHFGKLELRAYHPDKRLRVVTFLEEYVRRTKPLRSSSRSFISYQKPHASVTTDTVGRWLRKVLENSGLDVSKYGVHSTRAASTSAAKTVNISIQSIMDAAGWSNAETFRKCYDKPMDTEAGSFGTELLHAIDA